MIERSKLQMRLKQQSYESKEALRKLPLIEIVGRNRVLIENHKGVCEYGSQTVIIRSADGKICICGDGLELMQMSNEVLVVTGVVTSVVLQGRDHG